MGFIYIIIFFVAVIALGFGLSALSHLRGKLSIVPEKFAYAPGEKMKGTITFDLKKPTQANALSVTLIATRAVMTQRMVGGRSVSQQNSQILYQFTAPVHGAGEYFKGEYPYELVVPESADGTFSGLSETANKVIGTLEKVNSVMGALSGGLMNSPVSWSLMARLDIPKGLDMTETTQIQVG